MILSKKGIFFYFIILFALTPQLLCAQAKEKEIWDIEYKSLQEKLDKNQLTSDAYMKIVDSLTERLTVSGLRYSNEEMVNLLQTFKSIAWNNERKYQKFKANYYRFLMNNALGSGRSGEVLFYAEKNESEAKKIRRESLLIPYVKLLVWAKSGNYKQVIALYNEHRNYINTLLQGTINDSNITAYMQSMQFYYYTMVPLLEEDNQLAEEVKNNAIILEALIRKSYNNISNRKIDLAIPALLALFSNIEYYAHQNDVLKEKQLLDSALHIFNHGSEKLGSFTKPYENIINSLALNYYLKVNDTINAAIHLNNLQNGVQIFDDEKSNLFKYKSHLRYNQGKIEDAYKLLDSSLHYKTIELSTAYQDVTNLLYAHAESEFNKRELQQKEEKRKKQNIWITCISIISVMIILIAFLRIKKEKKKTKVHIHSMKKMSDIAVNETRKFAIIEERKKLGQDLHDDLSASLVSILHTIGFIKNDNINQEELKYNIEHLDKKVNQLYISIRKKSHHMYEQFAIDSNTTFEKSVNKIIDSVLSNNLYTKTIEIDRSIVSVLDLNTRIELLKILQESTTNILKHSKASDVNVFLYKSDNNKFIFQISDNGIGINKTTLKQGVGLHSIADRVQSINGQLEILNDYGTTIIIKLSNDSQVSTS